MKRGIITAVLSVAILAFFCSGCGSKETGEPAPITTEDAGNTVLKAGEAVSQTNKADSQIDKSCFMIEYEYDDAGNLIKEVMYDADGSVEYWHEYAYDSAGNETKRTVYNDDASVDFWTEYKYDSDGNRIEETVYWDDGSIERLENEYDSAGNQIKRIDHDTNGGVDCWWEYEYDNAGNMLKEIRYDADGSVIYWTEYDNIENRIWEHTALVTPYTTIDVYMAYEYDNAGNMRQRIHYNTDGSIDAWDEYEYDSAGHQTRATYYSDNGSIYDRKEYEYIIATGTCRIDMRDVLLPVDVTEALLPDHGSIGQDKSAAEMTENVVRAGAGVSNEYSEKIWRRW